MSAKSIQLKPKSSHFFWGYLTGILLIPLLGLGIYLIYRLVIKQSGIHYEITNQHITLIDADNSSQVKIAEIEHIDLVQRWTDQKFNTGTLIIHTADKNEYKLIGLENPFSLKDLLLQAAQAEQARLKNLMEKNDKEDFTPAINLDRLDYLTGLWQQGLLSDDDFKREKKHFES